MPDDLIEKSHEHLPAPDLQAPKPARRGLLTRILSLVSRGPEGPAWRDTAEASPNWSSQRGSFNPQDDYQRGKPKKGPKFEGTAKTSRLPDEWNPELAAWVAEALPSLAPRASTVSAAYTFSAGALPEIFQAFLQRGRGELLPLFVTAIDWPEKELIELVYLFRSTALPEWTVSLHTELPRAEPRIASAVSYFDGLAWHERETAELFGVEFTGHPDPRKLLLDSSYPGFPLRKEYEDEAHEFVRRPY